MKSNTIIETERLILRELEAADCEDMLTLHSSPQVQKYTGEPVVNSLAEVKKSLEINTFADYKNHRFGRLAVIYKPDNKFIGWAGLKYLPEFDEVDIGYRYLNNYWGIGIATEASLALLKYGFESLKLKTIIAIAMKENKASIRVMEKVGMTFWKLAPYEEGEEDAVWYTVDKTQYKQRFTSS